jgi:hypothetical protein
MRVRPPALLRLGRLRFPLSQSLRFHPPLYFLAGWLVGAFFAFMRETNAVLAAIGLLDL